MSKINPKTAISNIKKKIKSLTDKQKAYIKKYDAETIQSIKDTIETEIQHLETEIQELALELEELELFGKKGVADELGKLLKKKTYAYIATEGKFLLIDNVSNTDKVITLKEANIGIHRLPSYLNNIIGRPGFFKLSKNKGDDGLSEDTYIKVFQEEGCSFNGRTASYNTNNWSDLIFNTMDVQRKYWCPLSDEEYSPYFDDLIYCVCGGKEENINHLEQWLGYKYFFPERNLNTPHINITGIPGGNGKGILFEILRSMFTKSGVGETTIKAMEGGFNANEEGKTVIVVDDPNDKLPHAELKNRTGGTTQVIERKGVDAYEVDATANYIVFDNTGTIKLTGGGDGGEDRRWSIILTHLPLLDYLEKKYGFDQTESKEMAAFIADSLAKNRIEVGKFINHLIKKHNVKNMRVLKALHGEDYYDRLDEQVDSFTTVFDLILPIVEENGIIPNEFVNEIVNIKLNKNYNSKTIQSKFNEYLIRNGYAVKSLVHKCKIKSTHDKKEKIYRGRAKQINPTKFIFDYSHISSEPYIGANTVLTRETINIKTNFNDTDYENPLESLQKRINNED